MGPRIAINDPARPAVVPSPDGDNTPGLAAALTRTEPRLTIRVVGLVAMPPRKAPTGPLIMERPVALEHLLRAEVGEVGPRPIIPTRVAIGVPIAIPAGVMARAALLPRPAKVPQGALPDHLAKGVALTKNTRRSASTRRVFPAKTLRKGVGRPPVINAKPIKAYTPAGRVPLAVITLLTGLP